MFRANAPPAPGRAYPGPMAFERRGRGALPRLRHFTISPHAEDRMWERGIVPEDLTAILRNDPLIEWQDGEYPPDRPSP